MLNDTKLGIRPGWYKAEDVVSCSRTQHRASGQAGTKQRIKCHSWMQNRDSEQAGTSKS